MSSENRIPAGTRVKVRSPHFSGTCLGVVRDAVHDGGWLYRVDVLSGPAPEEATHEDGQVWLYEDELERLG